MKNPQLSTFAVATLVRIAQGVLKAIVCAFCLLLGLPVWANDGPAGSRNEFRIVGYLPDYRAKEFDPGSCRALTDLIVFSAEPTPTGSLDLSRLKNIPWSKLRAFKTRERVRLVLCVGGWERSAHFASVVATVDQRNNFVKSAVRVCLDERLDGMDLDWEHPKNEAEQAGYGKLLSELRAAFEPHGLVLSVTVAAWQRLPREAYLAVDHVNVMSYDHQGRHSTFEAARKDIEALQRGGAPAAKLVLGIPFYGRGVKDAQRVLTYREILAKFQPKDDTDEIEGLYFNGPAMVRRKTGFALDVGLGGIMVWEVGQDATGDRSLLRVIQSVVEQKRR